MKFAKLTSSAFLASFALATAACHATAPTQTAQAPAPTPDTPPKPPPGVPAIVVAAAEATPQEGPQMQFRKAFSNQRTMVRQGAQVATKVCEHTVLQAQDPESGRLVFDRRTEACEILSTDAEIAEKLQSAETRLQQQSAPPAQKPPVRKIPVQTATTL